MYKKCEEILSKLQCEGKIKISDYQFPPKQELKLKLKDMLEDEVDEKYYLSDEKLNTLVPFGSYYTWKDNKGNISTQCNRACNESGNSLTIPTVAGLTKVLIKETTQKGYVNNKYKEFIKEKGYVPKMFNPYNQKEITDIAPTQSTQCGSTTSSATVLLKSDLRIRKLTPKECWRLMGFSDDDFEKANKVCSDSQLYKQAGNSIVVVVLEHIFMSLFYGI
jgi:DNA (cytosine-5)-methyltransferase 1